MNMSRKRTSWRFRRECPEKQEDESAMSILKDFCEYTSWGGLNRVVGSKFIFFKFLWLLLFLAAFAAAIYQLVGLFFLYESKPISTRISLEHSLSQPFPTITLCNHNIILKSRLNDLPAGIKANVSKYGAKHNTSIHNSNSHKKSLFDDDFGIPDPESLHQDFKVSEEVAIFLAKQEESKLIPLGHQFYDMIRTCKFKGVDCRNFAAKMTWTTFWHYKFGNCFMFNPKAIAQKNGLIASKPGPAYGLIIELDAQQNEYIDLLTQNAGAIVDITPRGHMPFPFEKGINLAPGFSTSIGLRLVKISRVNKKNSCVNTQNGDIFAERFNTSYSKISCIQSCIAHNQDKYCGCMEYKFHPRKNVVCDVFNMTTVLCLRKVLSDARMNKLNCSTGCPPPCKEETFKISSSFSAWPSENYMDSFADKMKETNNPEYLRKNLLKVEIFYQDLNYEHFHETVSYQLGNFISDIGGQLGLWLGVSVLSGMEIIELIGILLIHLFQRERKNLITDKNKARTTHSNGNESFHMK